MVAPSGVWTCPTISYWAPSRLFGDGVELLLTLFGVQNSLFGGLLGSCFGMFLGSDCHCRGHLIPTIAAVVMTGELIEPWAAMLIWVSFFENWSAAWCFPSLTCFCSRETGECRFTWVEQWAILRQEEAIWVRIIFQLGRPKYPKRISTSSLRWKSTIHWQADSELIPILSPFLRRTFRHVAQLDSEVRIAWCVGCSDSD